MKKGRISNQEKEFIEQNIGVLTTDQIADKLKRDPDSVANFIKKNFKVGLSDLEEASFKLQDRPYWLELEAQFTTRELKMFDYYFTRIVTQFKDDVAPTEEMQIVDLVKFELLMNRCLTSNKSSLNQIDRLQHLLDEELLLDPDQQESDKVFNYERQITALKSSMDSLNRDYRDLQDKKNKMLKDMKATREQRIKRLDDKNQTFKGLMTYLISNPDILSQYGKDAEKRRLAMEKEKERLSQYHTYEDGMVDQPFLNAETVFQDEKQDEKQDDSDPGTDSLASG